MTKETARGSAGSATGRMGAALATRLLDAGHDVAVYNRTRSKAEALAELGATVVDSPADLADRDIVFTMVGGSDDFKEVAIGPQGVLSRRAPRRASWSTRRRSPRPRPTTCAPSPPSAARRARGAGERQRQGRRRRAADDGRLGPGARVRARRGSCSSCSARAVTYVGEGDRARLVKICHNLMLGVVAQTLAEITVLAEKGGVSRADFFEFLNDSVMGSMFTRYKTPAYVNLDFKPTFTPALLLKDFRLGAEAARELDVPMPVAAAPSRSCRR